MRLTDEQKAIIGATGRVVCVNAYAGTGKSTTMRAYALAHPDERILYLAFNRSVAIEARRKMPPNVFATTAHGLAYNAIGKSYKHKMGEDLRPGELIDNKWVEFPPGYSNVGKYLFCQGVIRVLHHFLQNDIDSFDDIDPLALKEEAPGNLSVFPFTRMIECAEQLWVRMCDPVDPVPMLHDGYMKLYSLMRPNLGKEFDTIQVDEAQDSNPTLLTIIRNQDEPRIMLIGDRHQQIYSFRNAVNAMGELHPDQTFSLTGSFRFGEEVAWRANQLIEEWKGEKTHIRGLGENTRVNDLSVISTNPGEAYIARTNAGVLNRAFRAADRKMKVYFVGGISGYRLGDFMDAYFFMRGRKPKNPLFAGFERWRDLVQVAKRTGDPELNGIVGVVFSNSGKGVDLPDQIRKVRAAAVSNPAEADVILCTAHKSKGLEFPVGSLEEDFPELGEKWSEGSLTEDEINLLYVAITRFTKVANLPPNVTLSIEGKKAYERRIRAFGAEQPDEDPFQTKVAF